MDDPGAILAQARSALKSGEARAAVRLYQSARQLAPRDPDIPHELGLALLETGEIGLAALAQREALALDPAHVGARAQCAAALQALGDDAGAAGQLRELLARIGPQPALSARLSSLEQAAVRARGLRLLGAAPARLAASPLTASAMTRDRADPLKFHAPFAELKAEVREGAIARLELLFTSMDASLGRSDLSYGGTTEDENGRRVPLDEFTAAGIVFLSEALGIDTLRARRMLSFLLAPECGVGPHRLAGADVGWVISGGNGDRRYGLVAGL